MPDRPEKKKKDDKTRLSLKRILSNQAFLFGVIRKSCPARLFAEAGIMVALAVTDFLSYSLLLRIAVNGINDGRPFSQIALLTAGFFGAKILIYVFQGRYYDIWRPVMEENTVKHIQKTLFSKAAEVDLACYEDPAFYDKYIKAINEGVGRVNDLISALVNTIYTVITLVANSVLMFTIDPVLILFSVVPFAASFLRIVVNKQNYKKDMLEQEQSRRRKYVRRIFYLNDFAKEVRLTGVERPMMDYYNSSSKTVLKGIKKYGLRVAGLDYVTDMSHSVVSYLGGIIYCVWRAASGAMLYGDAVVATQVVSEISNSLSSTVGCFTDFHKIALYTENLRTFLDYETKIKDGPDAVSPRGGDIVFENVGFTYSGAENPALKNVNIRIGRGERIALVGHNGAGKSTLIKLLMRLYEPTEGRILLDGRDVRDYKLNEYRAGFGAVFQDVRLFSLPVAHNVLGRSLKDEADRENVIGALKKSGSYDRVMKMENGIDTVLTREFDDKGEVLSGGEAQKLAIARVFTRDYFCIVLDEPTSALDPLAEADMYRHMNEAADEDKAVVFISHRLSSAVDADRVYLLDGGSVIESGTHAELMAKNGVYAEMFRRQAENYRTSGDKREEAAG